MSVDSNAQAIIDAALTGAEPSQLDPEVRLYGFVVPAGGEVKVVDTEQYLDQFRDHPRRKSGTFQAHDAESFVTYLAKHGVEETEVWADTETSRVVGVINAHALGTTAGHGDHRVEFRARQTDAWKAWTERDGKLLSQTDFAEHIEDRAVDIVRPTAADMLELAQTFQATIGVRFESSKALSSGERQLEYRETVDAKAGRAGHLDIPKDFDIAVRPFEGADMFKVLVRFRYRITDGTLRIGYRLERPKDVLREAFLGVVEQITAGVTAPVYRGASA